jgi:hypothetical protein
MQTTIYDKLAVLSPLCTQPGLLDMRKVDMSGWCYGFAQSLSLQTVLAVGMSVSGKEHRDSDNARVLLANSLDAG